MIQLLYSPFIYEFCHFRNFKERISTQSKKDEVKWRILVEKIFRMIGQRCDEYCRSNGAGSVHFLLVRERWFFQRFGDKIACSDDDNVKVGYRMFFQGAQ